MVNEVERRTLLSAEQCGEARIVGLGLTHRVGVIAQLAQPFAIDLGEGPAVERGAALIAMLLDQHAVERAAEQRRAFLALADEKIGETLQPRQHGDEAGPDEIVEFFCLHLSAPRRLGECWPRRNTLRESRG